MIRHLFVLVSRGGIKAALAVALREIAMEPGTYHPVATVAIGEAREGKASLRISYRKIPYSGEGRQAA